MEQDHLLYVERVNWGSYYTKPSLVSLVYSIIKRNIDDFSSHTLLDTSCGYGSFFQIEEGTPRRIGVDIDQTAIERASAAHSGVSFFCCNSLKDVSRSRYHLSETERILVVGNPPYNDTTSLVKKSLKKDIQGIDSDLNTRDLGISFLLSYDKLRADYICVLHPLSYLIKRANFTLLGKFFQKYKLIDSVVISSGEFSETSKVTAFPIIIALYRRDGCGMDYNFIQNYSFSTKEGKSFSLATWETISRYITKYPNQKSIAPDDVVAKFWTMRDINALKRSRTFITADGPNTVLVSAQKLDYYCYVDVFKRYLNHIPYYLGNCEVMIDNSAFSEIRGAFRHLSLAQHPQIKAPRDRKANEKSYWGSVTSYFQRMLGEHYVY